MRADKGGNQIERMRRVEFVNRLQHFQFRRGVEAIARFRFHRRRAVRQHAVEPRARFGDDLFERRGARIPHRVHNAAARFQQFQIRRAAQTHFKFIRAVTRENDVRVRVHKTGQNNSSARVEQFCFVRRQRADFVTRADGDNFLAADRQRAVFDNAQFALRFTAFRRVARDGYELRCRMDDERDRHGENYFSPSSSRANC